MFSTSSDSKTTFDSEDSKICCIAEVGLVQGKALISRFGGWVYFYDVP